MPSGHPDPDPPPSVHPKISVHDLIPAAQTLPAAHVLAKAMHANILSLDDADYITGQRSYAAFTGALRAADSRLAYLFVNSATLAIASLIKANYAEPEKVYGLLNKLLYNTIVLCVDGDVAHNEVTAAPVDDGQQVLLNLAARVGMFGHNARVLAREQLPQMTYYASHGIHGLRHLADTLGKVLTDPSDREQIRDALIASIRPLPGGIAPTAPKELYSTHARLLSDNARCPLTPDQVLAEIALMAHALKITTVEPPLPNVKLPSAFVLGGTQPPTPSPGGKFDGIVCANCTGFSHSSDVCPSPPLFACALCGMTKTPTHTSANCYKTNQLHWNPTKLRPIYNPNYKATSADTSRATDHPTPPPAATPDHTIVDEITALLKSTPDTGPKKDEITFLLRRGVAPPDWRPNGGDHTHDGTTPQSSASLAGIFPP